MKREKDFLGFKTWRCTGLINKIKDGQKVLGKDGKPEKIKCKHAKAWAHVDPYQSRS